MGYLFLHPTGIGHGCHAYQVAGVNSSTLSPIHHAGDILLRGTSFPGSSTWPSVRMLRLAFGKVLLLLLPDVMVLLVVSYHPRHMDCKEVKW
jgi:hypothetical protein